MLSTAAFNAFLKPSRNRRQIRYSSSPRREKHNSPDYPVALPDLRFQPHLGSGHRGQPQDDSGEGGCEYRRWLSHVIAQKADGAMRDALTIFDQTVAFCGTDVSTRRSSKNLNVLDYDYSFNLVDRFSGRGLRNGLAQV